MASWHSVPALVASLAGLAFVIWINDAYHADSLYAAQGTPAALVASEPAVAARQRANPSLALTMVRSRHAGGRRLEFENTRRVLGQEARPHVVRQVQTVQRAHRFPGRDGRRVARKQHP
jgi:hypothetical protein